MYNRICRISISILLLSLNYISSNVIGQKKVICLRVEFQESESSGTTGDGHFLMNPDTTCGTYIIDPPPHDRAYFQSHLIAVDNYFRNVSYQNFGIDLGQSEIFPETNDQVYTLPNSMDYYNPYGISDTLKEERLVTLFKDAIFVADSIDSIPFEDFDFVIVFHAGIGQDFSLPYLDPTPEDIPSTYVDRDMLGEPFRGVEHGIILPETENHLLFEEGNILFDQVSQPCDFQYGLTGVIALMVGFASNLPPLWDLETGESRIGIFGLMDQGSNNGRGLIPSPPDAWTRIFAGWETAEIVNPSNLVSLPSRSENNLIKVPITDSEYFLIENRRNTIYKNVSIDSLRYSIWEETERYPPLIEILMDSVNTGKDENGVITSIPNYDLGLPSSGLLIWHIDEEIINSGIGDYSINSDRNLRGVDLEEADGAQDIGYPNIHLFSDPSSGYFGDIWFDGNPEYDRINNGLEFPEFGPYTYPNTQSNDGASTFLNIKNISAPNDTMTFFVTTTDAIMAEGFPEFSLHLGLIYDFDEDGVQEVMGGKDSLWVAEENSLENKSYFYTPFGEVYDWSVGDFEEEIPWLVINERKIDATDTTTVISFFKWNFNSLNFIFQKDTVFQSKNILFVNDSEQNHQYLNPDETQLLTTIIQFDETEESISYGNWVSVCDLDLDGRGEWLSVEDTVDLMVKDDNGLTIPGFPIYGIASGNSCVLMRDLYGDEHPEIIVQNEGGVVTILNWMGQVEFRLANYGPLLFLGEFDGKNSIVTESSIWLFDATDNTTGNSWDFTHQDPGNARTLQLTIAPRALGQILMDKSRTYAYPNPAKDNHLKIRVQVESANHIECKIYDLAGFYIDKLVLSNPIQGMPNEMIWNVSDVESGIYYIDITAKRNSKTQSKLIRAGIVH